MSKQMNGNALPAHATLEALFAAVVEEARRNPAFARRLANALPGNVIGEAAKKSRSKTSAKASKDFDPASCHAVNILRQHGENMLRGRLSNLRTKTQLTQVARRSGLRLTGKAAQKSASRNDLIEGIVDAARHYDTQREAAEG
ncbi:MAG: hypothetical protein ACR2O4_00100 [Hyphomicrobiaceae bacterium]